MPSAEKVEWVTRYDDGSEKIEVTYNRAEDRVEIKTNGSSDVWVEFGDLPWLIACLAWAAANPPRRLHTEEGP